MAGAKDAKTEKPQGIMPFIIATVVAIVAGLGSGFAAVTLISPPQQGTSAEKTVDSNDNAEGEHEKAKKDSAAKPEHGEGEGGHEEDLDAYVDPADLEYAPLPAVIVNMAEPREVWIRLESGIAYQKTSERKPEALAAETAQQIAQYLKTVRLESIEGPDGMQFLQEDINTMVRTLSEGQVQKVLISGFIVE